MLWWFEWKDKVKIRRWHVKEGTISQILKKGEEPRRKEVRGRAYKNTTGQAQPQKHIPKVTLRDPGGSPDFGSRQTWGQSLAPPSDPGWPWARNVWPTLTNCRVLVIKPVFQDELRDKWNIYLKPSFTTWLIQGISQKQVSSLHTPLKRW